MMGVPRCVAASRAGGRVRGRGRSLAAMVPCDARVGARGKQGDGDAAETRMDARAVRQIERASGREGESERKEKERERERWRERKRGEANKKEKRKEERQRDQIEQVE